MDSRRRKLIVGLVVAALAATGLVVRAHRLGEKSYWGDEGDTFLAVEGIRREGIPRFPSGAVYYKGLLVSYLTTAFTLPLGVNEFALRLPQVLAGAAEIPAVYLLGRTLFGVPVGLASAALITFSSWEVQLDRDARHYALLQLVFTLGLLFLYRGFVQDRAVDRLAALALIVLSPLVHKLGLAVGVAYAPIALIRGGAGFLWRDAAAAARTLLGLEGPPRPRRRRIVAVARDSLVAQLGLVALAAVAWQLFESLFWKVGFVYSTPEKGGIEGIIHTVIQEFTPDYFHVLHRSYPVGCLLVWWLVPFLCVRAERRRAADREGAGEAGSRSEPVPSPGAGSGGDVSLIAEAPAVFLYATLILTILGLGFGKAHTQPRYLFFIHPAFVVLFSAVLFRAGGAAGRIAASLVRDGGPDRADRVRRAVRLAFFVPLVLLVSEHEDPRDAWAITTHRPGDRVDSRFTHSNSSTFVDDLRSPNEFLLRVLARDDLLITTGLLPQYAYSHRIDRWLWTAPEGVWDAFEPKGDKLVDRYLGVPLIRDLATLERLVVKRGARRAWIVTNSSTSMTGNLSPDVVQFLEKNEDKAVYLSPDGVSKVYLWEAKGK